MTPPSSISLKSTGAITISDLKDSYFDELPISQEQIQALKEFDKYRVQKLSETTSEDAFQKMYFDLQVLENTVDYREFLENFKI